ncbi:MAG: 7TM diverse intracellular signaling domain-containing protein, partial [Bacteroidota bacterium]
MATTYCLFIQHFLEMKTNFPRLNRMVNFGYFLFLGYTLLDLLLLLTIGKSTAFEMAAKFSLALPAIYVMAVIYKQNNRLFNLILLGSITLMMGAATTGIIIMAMKNGLYGDDPALLFARSIHSHQAYFQIGVMVEILLFSTALGYKSLLAEKEKNKALLQAAEARRLHDLDAVKTRLYTNITHEFRTPLTIILGMAQSLESSGGVQPADATGRSE